MSCWSVVVGNYAAVGLYIEGEGNRDNNRHERAVPVSRMASKYLCVYKISLRGRLQVAIYRFLGRRICQSRVEAICV